MVSISPSRLKSSFVPFSKTSVSTPPTPTPRLRNVNRVFCYDDGQEYYFVSDVELIRWENERALTVKGYDVYNGAIVPLFEAAGITDLKTSDQFKSDYGNNATGGFY